MTQTLKQVDHEQSVPHVGATRLGLKLASLSVHSANPTCARCTERASLGSRPRPGTGGSLLDRTSGCIIRCEFVRGGAMFGKKAFVGSVKSVTISTVDYRRNSYDNNRLRQTRRLYSTARVARRMAGGSGCRPGPDSRQLRFAGRDGRTRPGDWTQHWGGWPLASSECLLDQSNKHWTMMERIYPQITQMAQTTPNLCTVWMIAFSQLHEVYLVSL